MANLARLVAAFGRPRVQRMLIGAEMLTAQEALGCGYLAQVVAADAIEAAAAELCRRLASLAPVTQAVTKEALSRLLTQSLPDGAGPDRAQLRQRGLSRRRRGLLRKTQSFVARALRSVTGGRYPIPGFVARIVAKGQGFCCGMRE